MGHRRARQSPGAAPSCGAPRRCGVARNRALRAKQGRGVPPRHIRRIAALSSDRPPLMKLGRRAGRRPNAPPSPGPAAAGNVRRGGEGDRNPLGVPRPLAPARLSVWVARSGGNNRRTRRARHAPYPDARRGRRAGAPRRGKLLWVSEVHQATCSAIGRSAFSVNHRSSSATGTSTRRPTRTTRTCGCTEHLKASTPSDSDAAASGTESAVRGIGAVSFFTLPPPGFARASRRPGRQARSPRPGRCRARLVARQEKELRSGPVLLCSRSSRKKASAAQRPTRFPLQVQLLVRRKIPSGVHRKISSSRLLKPSGRKISSALLAASARPVARPTAFGRGSSRGLASRRAG
jgi:hypothetical protein